MFACHQLTPELAEDVSRARLLVLVDASEEPGAAGTVSSCPLDPQPRSAAVFSHHVDPARLLQLATELYGQSPPAVQVSIRVAELGPGRTCPRRSRTRCPLSSMR